MNITSIPTTLPLNEAAVGLQLLEQQPVPADDPISHRPPPFPSTMRVLLMGICLVGIGMNIGMLVRHRFLALCPNSAPLIRHRRNRKATAPRTKLVHENSAIATAKLQRHNSMLLLAFMAVADTMSLAALMLALCTQYLPASLLRREWVLTALCKLDLYVIHSASAFSLWCWLLLSTMRYVAVRRPYLHLRLGDEPLAVAALVAVACCTLEAWILYDVIYVPELHTCGETLPEGWSRGLQLVEITWTYFLPLAIITALDSRVLCCPRHGGPWSKFSGGRAIATVIAPAILMSLPKRAAGEGKAQEVASFFPDRLPLRGMRSRAGTVSSTGSSAAEVDDTLMRVVGGWPSKKEIRRHRRHDQQQRMLWRYLVIAILDLAMNLPNYLLRLYLTIAPEEKLEEIVNTPNSHNSSSSFELIHDLSQVLYFMQFSLNALYLVGIIYEAPPNASREDRRVIAHF